MNKGFVKTAACAVFGAVLVSGIALMPTKAMDEEPETFTVISAWYEEPEIVELEPLEFHITEKLISGFIPEVQEKVIPACPISEEEIVMLAKVLKRECGGITWDAYAISGKARQAAVAWCALNRVDDPRFPDTLRGVLTYPNAFAWIPDTYVSGDMLDLARDVVERWWNEKNGESDVGRTLPANYFFFHGDGKENHFRTEYKANGYWDWNCVDPYEVQE